VINVIDRGVDPTGEEPIRPQLGDIGDDVLLFFPKGRYLLAEPWNLSTFDRLAIIGHDATFVPREGDTRILFYTGDVIQSLRVEGVTFDFTAPQTGPRPMNIQAENNLLISDLAVNGSTRSVRFDITSPSGEGVIRQLRLPDGGLPGINAVGCLITPDSAGKLLFEDCLIEGFPNNGLYASPANGPITVSGGRYANNGIANVRVSGPSTVSDVEVECTRSPDGFKNMRGIWVRSGECLIDNCDISLEDVTYSEGGIVGSWQGTVRNTRIKTDVDNTPAISVKPKEQPDENGLDFVDVQISGTAANEQAILVTDYDPCRFNRLSVRQDGANRDGFHLIRSDGSEIKNTLIDVSGRAVYTEDSEITRENIRTTEQGWVKDGQPLLDWQFPSDIQST